MNTRTDRLQLPSSRLPGLILGVGLGGFIDGIALHQIVQWHNMASATVPPVTMEAMRRNMAWDGWFHVATLVLVIVGVFLLLRAAREGRDLPGPAPFTGLLFLGWGAFNLIEGIVDHHLLELHHVRDLPTHVPLYDWVFLAVGGVGFLLVGWLLSREVWGETERGPRAPLAHGPRRT